MKKIDKIIKNTILGGNMKKILFLAFLMSLSLGLFAAPAISTIGMSNTDGGGANTNTIQAGETIYISGTATSVTSGYQLQGVYNGDSGTTVEGELYVTYWNQTPNSGYTGATYGPSITTSFTGSGVGGTTFTGSFTLPSTDIPTDTQYITIYTGIFEKKRAAKNYSSVGETDFDFTTAPTGYYTRLDFYADTTTETPTLTNPAVDSKDNASIHINMGLPEDAKAGTVKLRIETDSSGSPSGTEFNTLTLSSTHENIGTDDFYINGADLTDDTLAGDSVNDVASVSTGSTAMSDGTVYHWKLVYQDANGNTEAGTAFHSFTYDTSISQPTSVSASDQSGSDIDVAYTLPEAAGDHENTNGTGEVVIVVNDTSDSNVATVTLENSSIASSGSHTITLNGSDLSASSYFIAQTGSNSLSSGTAYRFLVRYYDVAGNGPATSGYSQITYTTDSSTTAPTMDSASQNAGDHNFTFQFDLPEDALDNSVKIFIDTADDHDGSEGQIQLAGTYSAGNNQTVTLSLNTSTNKFDTSDGDIDSIANDTALSDGTTYYVSISYQDASGNAASVSGGTVTFAPDLLTRSDITFSAPTADSYQNGNFDVTYTLPETGTDGSVKLYFYNDSGLTSIRAILTLATGSSLNNTSSHTITLDPTSLSSATEVASADANYENTLIDNSDAPEDYYFTVKYQDQYGNDEVQSSSNVKFYFDDTTKAFAVDPTFSDLTADDDVQVTYTLPEDASVVYVYFYDTSKLAGLSKKSRLNKFQVKNLISHLTYAERSRALRSKLTIANTSTYYTGGENNTLTLDASDFINDSDVTSYNSTNNSLVDGTSYYVTVEYQDLASNTAATSNNSGTDSYDAGTEVPTMSSASELADANGPKLRVSYNLPEDGTNQTVKILVCNSDDATDIHSTITLEGHYSAGDSGNIDLDLPFATTDSDVYAVSGTTTLTDGTIYYVFVQYQDAVGNAAATSSSSKSFTWDGATQTPSISLPANNGSDNASLTVNVTYPETEYSGTLKLYISDHTAKKISKTRNSSRDSMVLTLTGITSGSDFVLDGSDLSAGNNTNISATSGLFSLVNGNQYDVSFGYRDSYGNVEAVSSTNTFTYDTTASAISISSPANNTTITGDFDLIYTKSEAAKSGTFTIKFDHATDDTKDATLTMNDTYCGYTTEKTLTVNVGTLSNTTGVSSVSGATDLVDGESYTIRFNYTDEAGNVATESTIDITYSTTTKTLTISKVAVDAGNPLDGNLSTWQPVMCYKAETNTSTATISSFKITRLGSNADTDFETDAVTLFESDDATLDTGSDNNLGAKAFASDWTWNSGFGSVGNGTSDKYYFFCVDVTSGFDEGHTIGSRVGDGDVASDADQTVNDPSGNLDSELKYLDGYTSIAGGDYGDASITPGTNDNSFFTFHIKSNQGSTTMTQVDIALSGSVVSGDFPSGAFQLYKDTDSDFAGATAIGSSLDYGSTLTFSGLSENITTTDTYYFLTCDVSSSADDTHNIQATLTASDSNPTTGYANILDADAGDISGGTHTLPVELSSFNITNTGRKVILAWTTQTETENQGFNIFRGISENDIENSQAMKLNKLLIPGAINSTQPTDYMFYDDKRIEYGTTYYYWIQTVDLGGYTEFSDPVSYKPLAPTDSHDIPGLLTYGLHTNYPNPFNPETTISFVLDKSSEVTLDIYNIKGQKIKSLYHDNATSGKLYKIVWNGKNDQNKNVASGVYFYRLKTAYSQYQKSMLLLK